MPEDLRSPLLVWVVGLGIAIVAVALLVDAGRKLGQRRDAAKKGAIEAKIRNAIEAHVWSAEAHRLVREALPHLQKPEDWMLLRVLVSVLHESSLDEKRTLDAISAASARKPVSLSPSTTTITKPSPKRLEVVTFEEPDPFPESSRISRTEITALPTKPRSRQVELVGGRLVPRPRSASS